MAVKSTAKSIIAKNKHRFEKIAKPIGFALLGFLFSIGCVMNGLRPFGLAIVAVSRKKYFLFSTAGAVLGYLAMGIEAQTARYLVAIVMVALGAFATGIFDLGHSPAFPMAMAFLADLSTGVVLDFKMHSTNEEYILTVGEAVLACGATFFLHKALNANYKRLRFKALPTIDLTCIIICIALLMMNLSSFYISLICPARLTGILLILITIRYGSERWGIIFALSLGFALGITNSDSLFIIGALGFSAIVGILFVPLASLGVGISFICSIGFFCVTAQNDISLSFFIDSGLATLIFELLPLSLCEKIENAFENGRDMPPDGSLRQNLVLKLRFASTAMAAISESVENVREKINDITRKENDRRRDEISEEEYITNEIILEKTNQIRMVASDQFYSIAGMLDDLAFELDEAELFDANASTKIRRLLGNFEIYPHNISVIEDKYGRIRVEILSDASTDGLNNPEICKEIGIICARYFQKGKITNFKNEAMLSFNERPNYSLNIGFAQHSAEGELCGDTVKIINDNKGHSILIISDGMGKGSRAALDGAMGAGLLSKLINAGFGFDSALKIVNSALLVKSNDESLATLDVASVDLFTGKCEIFKAGAPASYIIKDARVIKCELSSMPAGILRGIEFAKRTAILSPDDKIALMSDGITDFGDDWIENTLNACENFAPQECADFVLNSAIKDCDIKRLDDMSVIIAKVERN